MEMKVELLYRKRERGRGIGHPAQKLSHWEAVITNAWRGSVHVCWGYVDWVMEMAFEVVGVLVRLHDSRSP